MKTCDALIVGGGVIGSSIAYHLASEGFGKIIVCERSNVPGSGSTGKATGGFRQQFGSDINIQLSMLSRNKLLTFNEETGTDPEYLQQGYLFTASNAHSLNMLKEAIDLQHNAGMKESRLITIDDIDELNPFIQTEEMYGGSFCPSDGFISPMNILAGYTEASKRLGVDFLYGCELLGFGKQPDGRIAEAETSLSKISCGIVINAAGAWAGEIARKAHVTLTVEPLKRQVAAILKPNILPEEMPMTIFVEDGFHFRMRNGRLILLLPDKFSDKDKYSTEVENWWMDKVFEIAKKRIPLLKDTEIDIAASWAGLYEMSPDEHSIIGVSSDVSNFYFANGSSGHGVMHSPAIGQLLTEFICNKETSIDISTLAPSRFDEGKLNHSIPFF